MEKCKKILKLIFLIFIIFFLTGCSKSSDNDLQVKVISELDYVNIKTVNLLNKLNNLSFENYSVLSQQVKLSEQEQQSQAGEESQIGGQSGKSNSSGTGGLSGEGSGGSSDTKGSEEKQEKEGESQDKLNITTMVTNAELDKDRNDIDWTEIKREIELLNESWSIIVLDLYTLNVQNDTILSFSDKLNSTMISIKSEDKSRSLIELADLYSSIPEFLKEINADENVQKIRQTQSSIINAYVLAENMENTQINEHLTGAINTYSEIMSNIDYTKDKTEKINKIYVLLNELANSIDEKDSDIFYIKYKNLMKEIESL